MVVLTNRGGLGDDLMVFWAAAAASLGGLIPRRVPLYFERRATREFLFQLATLFPEVQLVDRVPAASAVRCLRPKLEDVALASFSQLVRRRVAEKVKYYDPYYNKIITEYGHTVDRPTRGERFAVAIGLMRVWKPPYEGLYDGWQQLSLGLGLSKTHARKLAARLGSMWTQVRERLLHASGMKLIRNDERLLFPEGGSFQDFGDSFIDWLKRIVSRLKIVRFAEDNRRADVYFNSLDELRSLISRASIVLTNDSLASHVAQFYAHKHILLCTRSRPENVCFPHAGNTSIIDLGRNLNCRPCAYWPISSGHCPAGFSRCVAQTNVSPDIENELRQVLTALIGNEPSLSNEL